MRRSLCCSLIVAMSFALGTAQPWPPLQTPGTAGETSSMAETTEPASQPMPVPVTAKRLRRSSRVGQSVSL
jgi:hypothetical protein